MLNLHSLILGSKSPEIDCLQYFSISKYANFTYYGTKFLKFLRFEGQGEKMQGSRRDFLKKSLKVGTAGGILAVSAIAKTTSDDLAPDGNGVVVGKSNKKEVLYKKSKNWETYYKIAY